MEILLLLCTTLVNFLFMMLTATLPVLVYTITNSTNQVGNVLTIFMLSLLLVRLICLKVVFSERKAVLIGASSFLCGFMIVYYFNEYIFYYFLGSVFFGMAMALIPPAVLAMLSSGNEKAAKRNIGLYNIVIALSSALAPLIGEQLIGISKAIIINVWLGGSVILIVLAASFFIVFKTDTSKVAITVNIRRRLGNLRRYTTFFVVFLLASIAYGAIITYLPVSLDKLDQSIGLFYLFFWGSYALVQSYRRVEESAQKENLQIVWLLLVMMSGELLLALQGGQFIVNIAGTIFGAAYGFLFKVCYERIGGIDDEHTKSDAYAIFGLMSYLGVGLAPTMLRPFTKYGFSFLFVSATLYIGLAFLVQLFRMKRTD